MWVTWGQPSMCVCAHNYTTEPEGKVRCKSQSKYFNVKILHRARHCQVRRGGDLSGSTWGNQKEKLTI